MLLINAMDFLFVDERKNARKWLMLPTHCLFHHDLGTQLVVCILTHLHDGALFDKVLVVVDHIPFMAHLFFVSRKEQQKKQLVYV
jgi:hypothetical protein